jgi:phage terminase small subunit
MKGLSVKQKAFADEYLKCGNAAEAYRNAGYKNFSSASVEANKTLNNPKVAAYIAERQKQIEDSRIADVSEVLQFFSSVMRGEVKDQFEMDAALSDRLSAGRELMKRYDKSDDGKKDALAKLDEVLKEIGGVI